VYLCGSQVTVTSVCSHSPCYLCWCHVQVVYSHNGVVVTATPVEHYKTPGPVAYRLDWEGLSVTYSGKYDGLLS
jgi:hypothetical protein